MAFSTHFCVCPYVCQVLFHVPARVFEFPLDRASRSFVSQVSVFGVFLMLFSVCFSVSFFFALGRAQDDFGTQHGPNLGSFWDHLGELFGHIWVLLWHPNLRPFSKRFLAHF